MQKKYMGLYLSEDQLAKLKRLADSLGTSRNRAVGALIDQAELVTVQAQGLAKIALGSTEIEGRNHD